MKNFTQTAQALKQTQKHLNTLKVEGYDNKKQVTVVLNGKLDLLDIQISPSYLETVQKTDLERAIKQAFTRAQKEVQNHMRQIVQEGKGFPGLDNFSL